MATLDEKSQAEQDALAPALSNEIIECTVCGRDCKHSPATAGGGTAGGVKGEKWVPTLRSQARCPSCGGKMHRKEGRIYQEVMCLWTQACNAMGATVLLHPTEDVINKMAELVRTGVAKPAPTEKDIAKLLFILDGGKAEDWDAKHRPKVVNKPIASTEIISKDLLEDGVTPGLPIDVADFKVPETKSGMKKKGEKKAKVKKEKKEKAPPAEGVIRKYTKEEEDAAIARAEQAALDHPIQDDDGYDPLAGIGQPFDSEDDDDEEELTEAQKAVLARQ